MNNRKYLLTRNLEPNKKKRVWEVDFLRAAPIILVLLYHFCFDISMIPDLAANYDSVILNYPNFADFIQFCTDIVYGKIINHILVPFFGGTFIFVCGISTSLTRNNLRRGLLLSLAATLISLLTIALNAIIAMAGENVDLFIGWGVIHLMAFSILSYALIELFSRFVLKKEVHPLVCLIIGVIIFFVGIYLNTIGYATENGIVTWPIKSIYGGVEKMYNYDNNFYVLSALGYYSNTVDWWPIFPYAGLCYIGIALGKVLYYPKKQSVLPKVYFKGLEPFCFIGRHTIWFYLLHQPFFIIVLGLTMLLLGFRL